MSEWQISRENLLSVLEVLELLPEKIGVPSSQFFRVQGIGNGKTRWMLVSDATSEQTMTGTGEWPVPQKGYWFLNRKTFTPFVQAAKEIKNKAPFQFKLFGKTLVVRHGRRRAMFVTQPAVEGYGGSLNGASWKMAMSDHVRGLVHCARDCASPDALVPEKNCVYVAPGKQGGEILATNQKVLFRAKSKIQLADPVPLPLFLVTLLGSKSLQAIEWQDGVVVLRFPTGRIWQSVSAKAKKFPREQLIGHIMTGAKKPLLFRVSTRKLALALQRLGLYMQAANRQDWVLEIKAEKGSQEIGLETGIAHAKFREKVAVDGEVQQDLELQWPLDLVIPVMEYVGQAHKKYWLEVRVWEATTKKGGKTKASYVRTGEVQLVIPSKA